jgi:hypothetical protein
MVKSKTIHLLVPLALVCGGLLPTCGNAEDTRHRRVP